MRTWANETHPTGVEREIERTAKENRKEIVRKARRAERTAGR